MSIVLDATTKKLEIILAGAVSANELPFTASYADYDASAATFTPGATDGVTNGAAAVTLVAAPGAGIQRLVNNISIYNKDTANAVITIQYHNNGTDREIKKITLPAGYSLEFGQDRWRTLNTNGEVLMSGPVGGSGTADLLTLWTAAQTLGSDAVLVWDDVNKRFGVGVASPDGTVHVRTGSSGATADSDGDDLIVESSGKGGMSILFPDNQIGKLIFGTPSDPLGAYLAWEYGAGGAAKLMQVGTAQSGGQLSLMVDNNMEAVRLNSAGIANNIYGLRSIVPTDDVSSPPTDAELDTAFGSPATVGEGFIGLLDDNNAETAVYLCVAIGSTWWYLALTKAT